MPCHCHAHAALCGGLEKSLSERHGNGMAQAWHGMCKSNTAALCESNGKDTIQTLRGTAWQGNGMGAEWERHGMCELAFLCSSPGGTVYITIGIFCVRIMSAGC
jgi:hypothetical protein